MYCRKCGREIPDDSVMCGYCGTPVNPDNPYTYGGTPQNMDEGANGLGIASMILGIVAILLACCAGGKWLTFFVAAAGLILGIIALQKPKYGSSIRKSLTKLSILLEFIHKYIFLNFVSFYNGLNSNAMGRLSYTSSA